MSREGVRQPRLLRGENGCLREAARLRPTALSVEMNLYPLCRARMTLAADDAPVRMHDFVEIYGQNGLLGIFRVTEIAESCGETREISLNHALDVFADAVLPGEETVQAPVAQVLARIAATQTAVLGGAACWQIGTVEDAAEYTLENRYDNALQCLCDLARRETDYYFSFDFSAFPWRLHFLRRNDEVLSEFRMSRNIGSCRVTADDGALCTRLYLSVETGEDGEAVTETYEDAAARARWGIICKTAGVRAADVPDRAAWARRYFARYGRPDVQITVDGEELNRLTGERMDEMHLGRLCRVALAESGAVYNERIVSIRYPDLLRQPERVTVCLAGKEPDAASGWAALQRRQRTADARMDRTEKSMRVMRTETRTRLTAHDRHITDIGTILHAAGLEIDAHGVWLYASEDGPNYALGASFKVQADNIAAEVTRATAAEGTMSAQLNVQAGQISSKVSQTDYNGNTIASLINQTATTILIQAARINLSGYVTASALDAQIAQLSSAIAQNITTNRFSCVHGSADYMTVYNTLTLGGGEGGGANVGSAIAGIGTASESGGQITIPTTTLTGSAGPSINFNIADTQFYRNAVASAETNGWNAARARVAPPSAGTGTSFTVDVPSATQGQTQTYTFTIQKGATPGTSGYASVALGQSVVGRISIGDWYSAGHSAGFTAGQSAGESIGYTRGWNAAEAQYSAASNYMNRYSSSKVELFIFERNTYYSVGTHYWYWSNSDKWSNMYIKS